MKELLKMNVPLDYGNRFMLDGLLVECHLHRVLEGDLLVGSHDARRVECLTLLVPHQDRFDDLRVEALEAES